MAVHDLGSPAYNKIDIECWVPGRKMYGEINQDLLTTNTHAYTHIHTYIHTYTHTYTYTYYMITFSYVKHGCT